MRLFIAHYSHKIFSTLKTFPEKCYAFSKRHYIYIYIHAVFKLNLLYELVEKRPFRNDCYFSIKKNPNSAQIGDSTRLPNIYTYMY